MGACGSKQPELETDFQAEVNATNNFPVSQTAQSVDPYTNDVENDSVEVERAQLDLNDAHERLTDQLYPYDGQQLPGDNVDFNEILDLIFMGLPPAASTSFMG